MRRPVTQAFRRRGVGIALTMARLERLPAKAVHYAAEAQHTATIRLHELLESGLLERSSCRDMTTPSCCFDGSWTRVKVRVCSALVDH